MIYLGLHDGAGGKILAGNELEVRLLALQLLVNQGGHGRVGLGQGRHVERHERSHDGAVMWVFFCFKEEEEEEEEEEENKRKYFFKKMAGRQMERGKR